MTAKKTGIITQARMTSTRLPGKILLEAKGIPLLDYHINRLKLSGLPIYIATTTNATDEPVVDFAVERNIPFYRGSEDHVLSRFYECAVENDLEVIIRVTSDCPLIDGNLIRVAVDQYLNLNNPELYISNTLERTFPRGFDFEVFSFERLEEAYKNAVLEYDKEHVTPYIHQNRSGKVKLVNIPNATNEGRYRITLDTTQDYELIKALIEDYDAHLLDYKQITNILASHPELVKINANVEQKQ